MTATPHRCRFVAHLDMLGMSQLSVRDPAAAWDALERLDQARGQIYGLSMKLLDTQHYISIAYHVELISFSDTIVAYTNSDTEDDLRSILAFFTELFGRVFYYRVPLRGGLVHGSFAADRARRLYSGPALVAAYTTGEAAQWLGLTVDATVATQARRYKLAAGTGASAVVEWPVPWRDGSESAPQSQFVVNWPHIFRSNFKKQPPLSVIDLYEVFEPLFGPFEALPPTVQVKYMATVDFINAQLAPDQQ
jgi:hypothetical protein